jgi:type VI secretion system protein ImpB
MKKGRGTVGGKDEALCRAHLLTLAGALSRVAVTNAIQDTKMTANFQREVPQARVNISVDLHAGGVRKRIELPLKLLVLGDYSAGRQTAPLAERKKIDINKSNFEAVLAELNPQARLAVSNTLAGDGSDTVVSLDFRSMRDFEPEQVARQIPELKELLETRHLLRELRSQLLDNATFRRELERVMKSKALSERLIAELNIIATADAPREGQA